ncbi:hypothetical protein O3P69_008941 [Scylla paramamosain]|uniref:Uncharacterized protein n=1 Tax=Scylla paramamosain TaxID=85552 RepID=A0AAW0TP94_SCYPA
MGGKLEHRWMGPYEIVKCSDKEWRKGKSLAIPDALSRAPVDKPSPEDVALGKEAYAHVRVVVAIRAATLDARSPTGDLVLDGIRTAAREDVIYTRLLERSPIPPPQTHADAAVGKPTDPYAAQRV